MSILKVSNLDYYYDDGGYRRYVLKNLNCSLHIGKLHAILGQSGSGKTTFLSLVGAMEKIQIGTIEYEGLSYKNYDLNTIRRNILGMVFQSYNLIVHMTAVENIMVAMSITDNQLPENKLEVAYNLLDYLGISKSKADRLVNKLSGGEQQRVAIARALSTNVDIVLADEPTGNVDQDTEKEIIAIFKILAHKHNKCVVVVTHSKEIASEADIVYILSRGALTMQN